MERFSYEKKLSNITNRLMKECETVNIFIIILWIATRMFNTFNSKVYILVNGKPITWTKFYTFQDHK